MARIAETYSRAGLEREAIDSLVESIYAEPQIGSDTDFSARWIRVARAEVARGETLLALRAYLNAAQNAGKETPEVVQGLQEALSGAEPEKLKNTARPTLSLEDARAIAQLYRKINLHPLALALLSRDDVKPDSPVPKERAVIADEWQEIITYHREVRAPDCVVLGQKVDDVADWSKVVVRHPSDTFWKPKGKSAKPDAAAPGE